MKNEPHHDISSHTVNDAVRTLPHPTSCKALDVIEYSRIDYRRIIVYWRICHVFSVSKEYPQYKSSGDKPVNGCTEEHGKGQGN